MPVHRNGSNVLVTNYCKYCSSIIKWISAAGRCIRVLTDVLSSWSCLTINVTPWLISSNLLDWNYDRHGNSKHHSLTFWCNIIKRNYTFSILLWICPLPGELSSELMDRFGVIIAICVSSSLHSFSFPTPIFIYDYCRKTNINERITVVCAYSKNQTHALIVIYKAFHILSNANLSRRHGWLISFAIRVLLNKSHSH